MVTMEKHWIERGDTLACFGDSITASATGYVKMLQKKLEKKKIKVINAGRGGDKTTWALTRLTDVINLKPTAVSIALGTNDAAVGKAEWADEPMIPPEVYKWNLVWIIHLCKLAGIGKFSITPPFGFEGDSLKKYGSIEPYAAAAREAASMMKTRFVPADVAFAEERAKHAGHAGFLLTTDGTHLTEKGNRIVADTMLEAWGLDK